MDSTEAKILLKKYENGECSEQEMALLESWFIALKSGQAPHGLPDEVITADLQEVWLTLQERHFERKSTRLWPRIAVAAAALAAVLFGLWFFNGESGVLKQVQDDVAVNDIAPGKNTAILTLANGKTINLSDQKTGVVIDASSITYNDGSLVGRYPDINGRHPGLDPGSRTRGTNMQGMNDKAGVPDQVRDDAGASRSEMTSVTTPRGGTYQIILPDGTHAWLNADSKISFPSQFTGKERKILLSGEAYFEVATSYTSLRGRRTKQSFIVESGNQEVTVLGTHFNINAYKEEGNIKTTLLEGSVRVAYAPRPQDGLAARHPGLDPGSRNRKTAIQGVNSKAVVLNQIQDDVVANQGGQGVILKPNQQAVLANNKPLTVSNVDVNEVVSWKDGYFRFYEVDLETFMNTIARWYDIEVAYDGGIAQYKDLAFGGSVSRSKNISEVLKILAQTGKVRYKIEGKKVTITK